MSGMKRRWWSFAVVATVTGCVAQPMNDGAPEVSGETQALAAAQAVSAPALDGHGVARPVSRLLQSADTDADADETGTGPLEFNGGGVISNVHVVPVFWTTNVHQTVKSNISCFYDSVVQSPYMDWLSEYNTPHQNIGRGTATSAVTISPSHTGGHLTDDDIQDELKAKIYAGTLSIADPNTIFMVYFPPGIRIQKGSENDCTDFCGYHRSFNYGDGKVRYAVFPDLSPGSVCGPNCDAKTGEFFDSLTSVSSHELIEAVTDPDGNDSWYGHGPEAEIGDLCNWKGAKLPGTYYTVQQQWSNSRGGCYSPPTGATFVDPPVIYSATPLQAAYNQTTSVTIQGACFANPHGLLSLGNSLSGFKVESGTFDQLQVTMPVSPSGGLGVASASLFNNGGAGPQNFQFTYLPAGATTISPSHGPMQGGTAVSIFGGPFPTGLNAMKVYFGSVPASSVLCSSTTSCVAYAPEEDPGTVDVIINDNGVKVTAASKYTFDGAQITSVTPAFGPITGGTSIDIHGINMADTSENAFVATAIFNGVSRSVACVREGLNEASCSMVTPAIASVPASPVNIQIQFKSAAGTTLTTPLTSAAQFTYKALPAMKDFSFDRSAVGGATVQGYVQLNGDAPKSGAVVSLAAASWVPAGVISFPTSITIPAGAQSANVPVTVVNQNYTGKVAVVATYAGTVVTGSLEVYPTSAPLLSVSNALCASRTGTGTITLGLPAPKGGGVISLTSDSPLVTVPASVTIPAGATTASFPITAGSVPVAETVHVNGTYYGIKAAPAAVSLLPVGTLSLSGTQILYSGASGTGTLTVCSTSTASSSVALASDRSFLTVPATVTIPAGATSTTFTFGTGFVVATGTAHVTAKDEVSTVSEAITVLPPKKPQTCAPGTTLCDCGGGITKCFATNEQCMLYCGSVSGL